MKRTFLTGIAVLSASYTAYSQAPDTMSIILNGEKISLSVPKTGSKTTINLEDSATITPSECFQVFEIEDEHTKCGATPG